MNRAEQYFEEIMARNELGHAYILESEDREERLQTARRIARRIQCEKGSGCGVCASCRAFDSGNHPDVIFVGHEKPNLISVEEIRRGLVEDMGIKPYRFARKVYVVDEAEKLNVQGQNALLKTLEEPPAYGIIILLTDNRNRFLPTVLSRATVLRADAPGAEDGEADDLREAEEQLFSLLHHMEAASAAELAGEAAALKEKGMAPEQLPDKMRLFFRDVLSRKAGAEVPLNYPDEERLSAEWAAKLRYTDCEMLWTSLAELQSRLQSNGNPDLSFEVFFLRLREALRAASGPEAE